MQAIKDALTIEKIEALINMYDELRTKNDNQILRDTLNVLYELRNFRMIDQQSNKFDYIFNDNANNVFEITKTAGDGPITSLKQESEKQGYMFFELEVDTIESHTMMYFGGYVDNIINPVVIALSGSEENIDNAIETINLTITKHSEYKIVKVKYQW